MFKLAHTKSIRLENRLGFFKLFTNFNLFAQLVVGIIVIVIVNVVQVSSHVSLTYPAARKIEIDFLSNVWTKGPCGMPKFIPNEERTVLKEGSQFNATWHLGYAHPGGHRFELLDSEGYKILDLTPPTPGYGPFVLANSDTVQTQILSLPSNLTCSDCTIRFLRQTGLQPVQSSNSDVNSSGFLFWSCADVDIVDRTKYVETCSNGRGTFTGRNRQGRCICKNGYWGPKCQYQEECVNNQDCNSPQGVCLSILGATNLPRRQCFCAFGFHGSKCKRANVAREFSHFTEQKIIGHTEKYLKLDEYASHALSDRMSLYYKIIPKGHENLHEIEFVLVTNGSSYAALGWRPEYLNEKCRNWPFILNEHLGEDWNPTSPFHIMDCTDIIIGSVVNVNGRSYSRIRDYFSQGRHTPKLDSDWIRFAKEISDFEDADEYTGEDADSEELGLSSAVGWEYDGLTTLIFRRRMYRAKSPAKNARGKIISEDTFGFGTFPDHTIEGSMYMIWSRGQEPFENVLDDPTSKYFNKLNNQYSETRAEYAKFYAKDEIKYHGTAYNGRGFTLINFPQLNSIQTTSGTNSIEYNNEEGSNTNVHEYYDELNGGEVGVGDHQQPNNRSPKDQNISSNNRKFYSTTYSSTSVTSSVSQNNNRHKNKNNEDNEDSYIEEPTSTDEKNCGTRLPRGNSLWRSLFVTLKLSTVSMYLNRNC